MLIFEDCLEMAWNEIKDRKGELVDGVWVKEAENPELLQAEK